MACRECVWWEAGVTGTKLNWCRYEPDGGYPVSIDASDRWMHEESGEGCPQFKPRKGGNGDK